jgi:hypothetical protein
MGYEVQRIGHRVDVRPGAPDPICVIGIGWMTPDAAESLAAQIQRALAVCSRLEVKDG